MNQGTLVVDLDGTLVRSDMLFESFWAALARNWATPLHSVASLLKGRAVLKTRLAELGPVDVPALPYNREVLDYIAQWRARGGRCALVTAANHGIAEAIAAHLDLFDEVHGSSAATNLKGETKARFLEERYGPDGFAYIGDAEADLPVWERASLAIVVSHSAALVAKLRGLGRRFEQIAAQGPAPQTYLKALRPHQWVKNLLVFVPLLAAHALSWEHLAPTLLAFVAFSLIASAGYVFNDLLDLAADRAHPRKRNRPFASGALPISHGTVMAPGLLAAGLLFALPLGAQTVGLLVVYFALTMLYSLRLKRQAMIDVCALACLYTLRIVAGGTATAILPSVWLLAFSVFFFLSLALVKRQSELVANSAAGSEQIAGRGYRASDLPLVTAMALASGYVSIVIMTLYMMSPDVLVLYHLPQALWGICLVLLYWISRMILISHRGEMDDDPIVFAARDPASQLSLLVMAACAIVASVG
ncbi:UbiA family prenyltransferase [Acidimangrovimonas pyrenivorans]|uniref:UbiA family prenyltransferase n=1 Tax=Acidimangrovimonas pyrenivorans TaxID=2030798 RepID=A0ABV7AIX2_9RHOB